MKKGRATNDIRCGKWQKEMAIKKKKIARGNRAKKRLVLPTPQFATKRFGRRLVIRGRRKGRSRHAKLFLTMIKNSGLIQVRVMHRIGMNKRVHSAEAEKISDKGE